MGAIFQLVGEGVGLLGTLVKNAMNAKEEQHAMIQKRLEAMVGNLREGVQALIADLKAHDAEADAGIAQLRRDLAEKGKTTP